MSTNQAYCQNLFGSISLFAAAITVVAAFAVVMLPMLIPAWITWSITLASGMVAILGAISSLSLNMTPFDQ